MPTGRPPKPAPVEHAGPEFNVEAYESGRKTAGEFALIDKVTEEMKSEHEVEKDEVLAAGIDLGRLEALDFVAMVANSAILPIYENVKKSKAWRLLRNPQSANGSNFSSLDEFCEVKLGKTYGRMQHLLANRDLIGAEAFEQAERMGLRQVDYNAIKALPAPDQELIRRAVEEDQSRDQVLGLLQELAARHAREKETLTNKVVDTEGELAASRQVIAKQSDRIQKLNDETRRFLELTPDETLKELQNDVTRALNLMVADVRGPLRMALVKLKDHDDTDRTKFMEGVVGQVAQELGLLREELNLLDITHMKPEWAEFLEHEERLSSQTPKSLAS